MKIQDVRTYVLRHELTEAEHISGSTGWITARQALIVEIVTDDGLSGFGQALGPPVVNRTIVDELYRPRLLGRDPLEHALLWEQLRALLPPVWPLAALSAVDVALWDLAGQALGQPVYRLLGGPFRPRIRAYATGLFHRRVADNEAALADEAAGYVAAGFRAMKLKIGFGLGEDLRMIRAVREAIGPECLLGVDANQAYDAGEALRLVHQMAPYDLAWFEEPVPPDDLDGYCHLRAMGGIPLAAGEAEYTRRGFRDLCARHAVDILQIDVAGCGGLTEALRLANLAFAAGIIVYPHFFGAAVNLFASVHLLAALPPRRQANLPSEPLLELDHSPNALREHLALNPLQRTGDLLDLPTGPGLGLQIDRAALERFRV